MFLRRRFAQEKMKLFQLCVDYHARKDVLTRHFLVQMFVSQDVCVERIITEIQGTNACYGETVKKIKNKKFVFFLSFVSFIFFVPNIIHLTKHKLIGPWKVMSMHLLKRRFDLFLSKIC